MEINLADVFDSLDAIVYIADMKTHEILFVNRYIQNIFGDIVGKKCWSTLQSSHTGQCAFCSNEKLLTPEGKPTGVYHREFQNSRNGLWYDVRDRAITWPDGRTVRLEIATDITERKLTEIELRNSEERFRTIVNNSQPVIFMLDNNGVFLLSEGKALSSLGLKPGEAVGKSVFEMYKDYPEIIKRMNEALSGNASDYTVEVQGVFFDVSVTPYKNEAGEVQGIIGMAIDITDLIQADTALKQRVKELEEFYSMAVGREIKMKELKKQIETLKDELSKYKK